MKIKEFLQQGLDLAIQVPVACVGSSAILLSTEGLRRIGEAALKAIGCYHYLPHIAKHIPSSLSAVYPVARFTNQQIGVSLLACVVIGALGQEAARRLSAKSSPLVFNDFRSFISPIKLDLNNKTSLSRLFFGKD